MSVTSTTTPPPHLGDSIGPPKRSTGARTAWTCVGLVLAAAAVAGLATSLVGNVAYAAIPSSQRSFTNPLDAVIINLDSGSVTVEPSSVGVTVVKTFGTEGVTLPTDSEHVSGRTLFIKSSCGFAFSNNHCNRNYILHVPPRVAVSVSSGMGDIVVNGIKGALSLASGQGNVTDSGAVASLHATSSQGDVIATKLAARSVSAESGQGNVDLAFDVPPNRATATSSQGDVSIELPNGPTLYRVIATSYEGNVADNVANVPMSHRLISASSSQGNVTVKYRSG